jgi:hypothetical protein
MPTDLASLLETIGPKARDVLRRALVRAQVELSTVVEVLNLGGKQLWTSARPKPHR